MDKPTAIAIAEVSAQILRIRGLAILLDARLATLYLISPSALMQAVRRNADRFPSDFMFQITNQELTALKSQFVISKPSHGRGGRRALPYAFTEQGVAMLSSVLRSTVAVQVNIEIMRAFVRLRRASLVSRELMKLIEDLSTRVDSHDSTISELVEAIQQLTASPSVPRTLPIGFTADWS
jgi:methyl-accepting chemotaxis protein